MMMIGGAPPHLYLIPSQLMLLTQHGGKSSLRYESGASNHHEMVAVPLDNPFMFLSNVGLTVMPMRLLPRHHNITHNPEQEVTRTPYCHKALSISAFLPETWQMQKARVFYCAVNLITHTTNSNITQYLVTKQPITDATIQILSKSKSPIGHW
jgi:hypothetical protein